MFPIDVGAHACPRPWRQGARSLQQGGEMRGARWAMPEIAGALRAACKAAVRALGMAWIGFLLIAIAAAAQDDRRLAEQDIKAGLLYNFLRYTDWPATAQVGATINVCIYGRDPFGGRLAPMAGRSVNQRIIAVRTVSTGAELGSCALLFINAEERAAWPRLRGQLSHRSVLTVSDYEGFARAGGMLEFTRANNHVGIMINVGAAHAADLDVEDRLLRLATVVSSDSR